MDNAERNFGYVEQKEQIKQEQKWERRRKENQIRSDQDVAQGPRQLKRRKETGGRWCAAC